MNFLVHVMSIAPLIRLVGSHLYANRGAYHRLIFNVPERQCVGSNVDQITLFEIDESIRYWP